MEVIIISLLVALLFFLLWDKTERFTPKLDSKQKPFKQCDFNDKGLSKRCKEVRDGCMRLKKDEVAMTKDLKKGCELVKDAKTVRETISNRRYCVTDVERLIRTKYAKQEMCGQIKNVPRALPKDEQLTDLAISNVKPYDINGGFSDVRF
jgi:hypothetical protein